LALDHSHSEHSAEHGSHHASAISRLKSAEGHLRGVTRMLEEDAYCIDVIHQIQAVQAALAKISVLILDEHLSTCVLAAIRGEDASERERVLKEISDVFGVASKSVSPSKAWM
jgi:DNA-binding FrmR family transcriptional regulator